MGIFDSIAGPNYGAFGSLLGYGTGVAIHPSQLAAIQQQQQQPFTPLTPLQQFGAQSRFLSTFQPRKHVESREVTPRERSRKAINGAVQAVKDAQKKVRI